MAKWWDIFIVAVNAKHSISVHELLRTPTEAQPRQAALLSNTNEQAAERKIVSTLFLSLGAAGRKNLTDKYPHMTVATASLRKMKTNCEDTFQQPKKLTLDRFKFFLRKKLPNETLRQFWNVLTGLAARCEFEQQTEGLIMDTFIQNIHNKTVQERLCTDPKEQPQEALRFAIAFEERIIQQQSFTSGNVTKKEPVCAIEKKTRIHAPVVVGNSIKTTYQYVKRREKNVATVGWLAILCVCVKDQKVAVSEDLVNPLNLANSNELI